MSDDRLEKALEAMRQEDVDPSTLDAARARVWDTVAGTAGAGCAEFRPDFPAYLTGALGDSRRVLLEDHLSRCPACRAAMAEQKGERRVIAMPQRSSSRYMRWGALAAAAVLIRLSRNRREGWRLPSEPRVGFSVRVGKRRR